MNLLWALVLVLVSQENLKPTQKERELKFQKGLTVLAVMMKST